MWLPCKKFEIIDRLFLRLILTSKNKKLFKSSASNVNFIFLCVEFLQSSASNENFIFLCVEFLQSAKSFKCSLDLNRTKMLSI